MLTLDFKTLALILGLTASVATSVPLKIGFVQTGAASASRTTRGLGGPCWPWAAMNSRLCCWGF